MEAPSIHCSLHLKSSRTFRQLKCHFLQAIQLRVGGHPYLNVGSWSCCHCKPYHTPVSVPDDSVGWPWILSLTTAMVGDFVSISLEKTSFKVVMSSSFHNKRSLSTPSAASLSAAVEMTSSELLEVGSFHFIPLSGSDDFIIWERQFAAWGHAFSFSFRQ